jgi:hypothetical protein
MRTKVEESMRCCALCLLLLPRISDAVSKEIRHVARAFGKDSGIVGCVGT